MPESNDQHFFSALIDAFQIYNIIFYLFELLTLVVLFADS